MSCFYTIVCMGPIGLYLLTNIVQVRKGITSEKSFFSKQFRLPPSMK